MRSSRISQRAGSSACRLPGPGDYRRPRQSSARISVSSGPVKECTGLMSTRTSVSKVCFMVSRRIARDRDHSALKPVPDLITDRLASTYSRRAASVVLKPGVVARAADAQRCQFDAEEDEPAHNLLRRSQSAALSYRAESEIRCLAAPGVGKFLKRDSIDASRRRCRRPRARARGASSPAGTRWAGPPLRRRARCGDRHPRGQPWPRRDAGPLR